MRANEKRIVGFALKSRLPSMYANREAVDAGGLMYYGADLADSYRRVAYYVDRILKGAKPADLPVEQPTKFELVINLKTAKQIGLTIPPEVLARADQGDQMTILDCRLSSRRSMRNWSIGFEFSVRQSEMKIQNRKWLAFPFAVTLFALCGAGRRAAAGENLPHRFPGYKHCFW